MRTTKQSNLGRGESSFFVTANHVWFSVGIAVAMNLAGCNQDYTAPLVGEYYVVRNNASTICVTGPSAEWPSLGETIAGPLVVGIDVVGSFIAGNAILPPHTLPDPPPTAGYFVIDAITNVRWLGLSKQEFDARCKLLGIEPNLKPPSYFKK